MPSKTMHRKGSKTAKKYGKIATEKNVKSKRKRPMASNKRGLNSYQRKKK